MSSLYKETTDDYIHRIVAQEKIGRKLKSGEIVHHIDEDKTNNNPENLMVFKSRSAHICYHNGGILIPLGDGTYDCKSSNLKKCIACKKILDYKNTSGYCREHYNIFQRKIKNRPSKEKILKLLETNSYIAVGKMYNVSDNAIRKWLK